MEESADSSVDQCRCYSQPAANIQQQQQQPDERDNGSVTDSEGTCGGWCCTTGAVRQVLCGWVILYESYGVMEFRYSRARQRELCAAVLRSVY